VLERQSWLLAEKHFVLDGFNGDFLGNPLQPRKSGHALWGLHGKSIVTDDKNLAIGSFNWDSVSTQYSLENLFYFDDEPALATDVRDSVMQLDNHSHKLIVERDKKGRFQWNHSTFDKEDLSLKPILPLWLQSLAALLIRNKL